MSKLSRRSLVAGAATLPALAGSVAAATALANPAAPDAELLRLGAALDRLEQDWIAQATIDAKRRAEWEDACIKAGLPRIPFGTIPNDEWRAHCDKRDAIRTESGEWEREEEREKEREKLGLPSVWDKIQDPLFPLVEEILSLKAATPAGLAMQAKAVAYAAADLWDPAIEDTHERLFIEAACAFCKITPFPIARRQLKTAADS